MIPTRFWGKAGICLDYDVLFAPSETDNGKTRVSGGEQALSSMKRVMLQTG